jgi:hypothetical protein
MSHRPTEASLRTRARTLVERMTERERWIYAVPPEEARTDAPRVLAARGWKESAPGTWTGPEGGATVRLVERSDLAVTLVEARGADAAEPLGAVLEATTFYAQSTLLAHAHDRDDEESETALATLAAMCVAWDPAWESLFTEHLGDIDAPVRAAAAASLVEAAATCGDAAPARRLLAKALATEGDDDARGVMQRAAARLGGDA